MNDHLKEQPPKKAKGRRVEERESKEAEAEVKRSLANQIRRDNEEWLSRRAALDTELNYELAKRNQNFETWRSFDKALQDHEDQARKFKEGNEREKQEIENRLKATGVNRLARNVLGRTRRDTQALEARNQTLSTLATRKAERLQGDEARRTVMLDKYRKAGEEEAAQKLAAMANTAQGKQAALRAKADKLAPTKPPAVEQNSEAAKKSVNEAAKKTFIENHILVNVAQGVGDARIVPPDVRAEFRASGARDDDNAKAAYVRKHIERAANDLERKPDLLQSFNRNPSKARP